MRLGLARGLAFAFAAFEDFGGVLLFVFALGLGLALRGSAFLPFLLFLLLLLLVLADFNSNLAANEPTLAV